uniref:Uncharacterized protein n=1 Tax=Strigops habroptila TaxID=2489341 RepID=A0A672UMU5_STRHB
LQPGKLSHPIQVAQEKLRAEIYDQMNTCNMLLYQVRQRSRAREQLQRRLQQLQIDAQMDAKQHQVVRTLENNIEKMQTKVHAGQKVTALYLVVRDALRKVSSSSLCHCLTCSPCKGTGMPKGLCWWDEHMARMETQFLAEGELRHHTLAAQKVPVDRRWLKEASERLLKAVSWGDLVQAGLWAEGRHQCPASHGWGAAGPAPPGCLQLGGDDERPCSKPGMTSLGTS